MSASSKFSADDFVDDFMMGLGRQDFTRLFGVGGGGGTIWFKGFMFKTSTRFRSLNALPQPEVG